MIIFINNNPRLENKIKKIIIIKKNNNNNNNKKII